MDGYLFRPCVRPGIPPRVGDLGVAKHMGRPLGGRRHTAESSLNVSFRPSCSFDIIAAANPCPCGGGDRCACGDEQIWQYRARLSGPLADRLDLAPAVARLSASALLDRAPGEPSAAVAARVARARALAADRWGTTNREARPAALRVVARPTALQVLAGAVDAGELTGRGFDRALSVARSCADLEGSELVEPHHAFEALAHRMQLRAVARAPLVEATA